MSIRITNISMEQMQEAANALDALSNWHLGTPPAPYPSATTARSLRSLADDLRFAASTANPNLTSRARWEHVNWRHSDVRIAEQLGVTRQAVYAQRQRRGEPKPARRHVKADLVREHLESRRTPPTIQETANALNVTPALVRSVAKEHDLPVRHGNVKYEWAMVDWERQSNNEIIEMLGLTGSGAAPMVSHKRRKCAPHTIRKVRGERRRKA